MAENDEEIIIIEEEDAAGTSGFEERYEDQKITSSPKKKIILLASVFGFLIFTFIIFLLTSSDEPSKYQEEIDFDEKQTSQEQVKRLSPSELEKMIKRANYLYAQGNQADALVLYEKIASYSESISYYNLGVAQMQDKQYAQALENFDKAIENNQNLCVSALNAAVASLQAGDRKKFDHYINMARTYLPQEASSPMYSYYYALVNFYQENYLEALSPLKYRSSQNYTLLQNQLNAKINLLFASYNQAIESLEKDYTDESALSLGLLYANKGELTLAKKYLRSATQQGLDPIKSQLALAYVNLKSGQIKPAYTLLENITAMYPEEVYTQYPIETFLKESLFDVNLAQQNFHNNIIHNQETIYQILFYFAPYKIFNATQTISYIRKGNANVSIDNVTGASEYLSDSASLSKVNVKLSKAIQLALSFHVQEANEELKKMVEEYPRHPIVHYNLALSYAQMGELNLAHEHFKKSYHLDAKNYLSGIFAMMASKVTNQKNEQFDKIIKENLTLEPENEEYDLYRMLVHYRDGNLPATYQWMERQKRETPFYLAFDTLIAMSLDKHELAKKYSQKLVALLPNDILPHLIYIDAHYAEEEQKMFARKALAHLKRQTFSMDDYYYGPFITKYLYTQYSQITGSLYPLKKQLEEKMDLTRENPIGIMQTLALVDIHIKDFEEAFTIYNQLIDQYKQQDSNTLFLAAIAATGAKHPANAIALLEIARRKNPKHSESRYALGLLYLQTQNNDGAVVSLKHIDQANFQSQYFNFRVVR